MYRRQTLRPAIIERSHQLIDAFVDPSGGPGKVELMAAFASPLPLSAISQLLAVPEEDEADIYQWMHGFKLAVQMLPLDDKQMKVANDSMSALDTYFRQLVARRRSESVDDLVNKMIADTDDGLYMELNRSWSIDDKRLNFQFGTEIAYEIKNGKMGRMIKNATYTGITPQFWGSCDAICNANHWRVWGTPNCGKGQPSQVAHTGHGTAAARFRNVRVGVIR